jgi:hypothetical protein
LRNRLLKYLLYTDHPSLASLNHSLQVWIKLAGRRVFVPGHWLKLFSLSYHLLYVLLVGIPAIVSQFVSLTARPHSSVSLCSVSKPLQKAQTSYHTLRREPFSRKPFTRVSHARDVCRANSRTEGAVGSFVE